MAPILNPERIPGFLAVLGLFHVPEKCHVTWNFLEARGPTWILGKSGLSVVFRGFSTQERCLPVKPMFRGGRLWILAVFGLFSRLRNGPLCGEKISEGGRKVDFGRIFDGFEVILAPTGEPWSIPVVSVVILWDLCHFSAYCVVGWRGLLSHWPLGKLSLVLQNA